MPTPTPPDGTGRTSRPRSDANYAARRMLVGTVAITVAVCAAVVGWRITRGDAESSDREGVDWDELALIERSSGNTTFVDAEGEVLRTSLANGRALSFHVAGGRVVLVGATRLNVLPVSDDDDPLVVDLPDAAEVTTIGTDDRDLVVIGQPRGGTVTIVDPATDTVIDIGDRAAQEIAGAPLLFAETLRWNHAGTRFAVADANNFQTIVVEHDDDGVVFLADQPVAVGDDLIATGQTVGLQSDIALVSLDRSVAAAVPTEIPAGGVLIDETLTMVSIEGTVMRLAAGDDAVERLGTLAIPAGSSIRWAVPTMDGERIVVAGDMFQAVVDLDGTTLFSTRFTTATEVDEPHPSWACLPIGGEGSWHSMIDLDTGEQLADISDGEVIDVAADGCTVLVQRGATAVIVSATGDEVSIGRVESAHLGPDGRSVVRLLDDRTLELVRLTDDGALDTPIDLTTVAGRDPMVAFVTDR